MVRIASARELTTGISGVGVGFMGGFIANKALEASKIAATAPATPVLTLYDWIHMIISGGCLFLGKPELGVGYLLGSLIAGKQV